ncbi:MAG TPA: hypothetical protein PK020_20185 [Ilumatobacteraceae bacterium]|nr:hypothetical protein [Ilumatobacteraceae bacterium]HRB04606.1 hypothetical protein [Ilumatobacteraceae bacterium]
MAHTLTTGDTLTAWLERIAADGEPVDPRLCEAAADLVETMRSRPEGLDRALARFGTTLGGDGWPIAQVGQWLQLLGDLLPRHQRKQLTAFSAHAAVAHGWAEGFVRGAHSGLCTDPTTGLVTVMVLQLRLREVYQQCQAAGAQADSLYSLVVIDMDTRGESRLEADLLTACIADAVAVVFRHGETIARAGDRILVLAANAHDTHQRVEVLSDRLWLDASTRRANATVVVDTMPSQPELLEAYLKDWVG